MKCFRLRCYVNNSFLVFHQGTKHSKTIKHSRFALVFHTVFSCLDPLMKHSNSLFTYNITHRLPVSRNENQRVTRSSANTFAKVIVKFTRRSTKEKFYHGRLRLKDKSTRDLGLSRIAENKLFISESLSPRNKQLFKDCLKFILKSLSLL